MENPKPEGEVIYPPTLKPGDPEKQKHPTKGKLVRYVGGNPVYEADLPGYVRPSEKLAVAKAAKAAAPAPKGKAKKK